MSSNKNKGFLKSFDGTKIYYESHGDGPPLILCYGIVCTMSQWKYQLQYFKKKHSVILFDYRGHNKSKLPKNLDTLTIQGCMKDLKALMDHLDIKKAVLLGHSMGINVIFDFAYQYPSRTQGLVAICGTVENPLKTMFNTDISQIGFEFLKMAYLKFPSRFPTLWEKSLANPMSQLFTSLLGFNIQLTKQKDIKIYLKAVSKQPVETYFHLLQDMTKYNGVKRLSKIEAPTLVIGGTNDVITPIRNQQVIFRKLPNAKFLKVPQGSHCSHMDMHQLVNLRIEKFLRKIKEI